MSLVRELYCGNLLEGWSAHIFALHSDIQRKYFKISSHHGFLTKQQSCKFDIRESRRGSQNSYEYRRERWCIRRSRANTSENFRPRRIHMYIHIKVRVYEYSIVSKNGRITQITHTSSIFNSNRLQHINKIPLKE